MMVAKVDKNDMKGIQETKERDKVIKERKGKIYFTIMFDSTKTCK